MEAKAVFFFTILGLMQVAVQSTPTAVREDDVMLFDFTSPEFTQEDMMAWVESSDTARRVGKSKGAFVLQKTQVFQRGVLMAVINPQPNGAGFVGFSTLVDLASFVDYTGIVIKCRGQGQLPFWKIGLNDTDTDTVMSLVGYEQRFEVNLDVPEMGVDADFEYFRLPFDKFEAYNRGTLSEVSPPLDVRMVKAMIIQAYGGVKEDYKERGSGSLEIDYIGVY